MTWLALCSAKGSPGVTTLICALGAAWPVEREVVVLECDPAGGDLAARFGLSTRSGMTSLVLQARQDREQTDYRLHVQTLPGGLNVLVGPTGTDSALTLDHELARSSAGFISTETDVVIDCGRLVPNATGQARMISQAQRVILILRSDVPGMAHARWATERIRELTGFRPSVVTVGTNGYSASEVSQVIDVDILGTLPWDPRGAQMASGGPGTSKEFKRSPLIAFSRTILGRLLAEEPHPGSGAGEAPPQTDGTANCSRRRFGASLTGLVPGGSRYNGDRTGRRDP
jgi:MinD-like ATPase involved in chromosome partitioning or flagellar assembly